MDWLYMMSLVTVIFILYGVGRPQNDIGLEVLVGWLLFFIIYTLY